MAKLASILFSFCLTTILWWGGARIVLPPPEDARATYELIQAKEAIAAATPARDRFFFVGGSSSRYGYSAAALSQLTGFNAVNLGSHAGLGSDYLLDRAKRSLRSGDTVLLALEPGLLFEGPPTFVTARIVQFGTPSYVLRAPFSHWPRLIFGVTPHDLLRSWLWVQIGGKLPLQMGEKGDETGNRVDRVVEAMRARLAASELANVPPQGVSTVAPVVREFITWCREAGVHVVIGWPTILYREAYVDEARHLAYEGLVESFAALGVTTIGRQTDFLLKAEHMFDTSYHANDVGRELATRRLAQLLCRQVRCPHPSMRPDEKAASLASGGQ